VIRGGKETKIEDEAEQWPSNESAGYDRSQSINDKRAISIYRELLEKIPTLLQGTRQWYRLCERNDQRRRMDLFGV
jgi:hypothetical protein